MADGIVTGRREEAAHLPNARNVCRATVPILPIVQRPAPRAQRRSGAAIRVTPGISIVMATALAANSNDRAAMTEEEHLWACALAIERLHGADAPLHITERIGALALANDMAGVARWRSIAACLAVLKERQIPN